MQQLIEKNLMSPYKYTNNDTTYFSDILQGRRIIDLGYFAKMMHQGWL